MCGDTLCLTPPHNDRVDGGGISSSSNVLLLDKTHLSRHHYYSANRTTRKLQIMLAQKRRMHEALVNYALKLDKQQEDQIIQLTTLLREHFSKNSSRLSLFLLWFRSIVERASEKEWLFVVNRLSISLIALSGCVSGRSIIERSKDKLIITKSNEEMQWKVRETDW